MPAASLTDLGLSDKTPAELELIRRELIATMNTEYKGWNDPEVPIDLLNRLAVVTGSLRRKNTGPPKTPKAKASNVKLTVDDFSV